MITLNEYSYDEQVALDNERHAFKRMQSAQLDLVKQSTPHGRGALTAGLLDECEQAYADWRAASAVFEQIFREIQAGARR